MDLGTDSNTGSISDLIGGDPAPAVTPPAGGDPAPAGGDPTPAGDVPANFLAMIPGEAPDGEPSLQDWVKSAGVKDVATLAKIARDNQKALRESGRIKIPGEGATPQEVAEYRAAIGVPNDPTGYTVPEFKDAGGNPIPINTALTERIFAKAHELGGSKALVEQLVASEIEAQIAEHDEGVKALQQQARDHMNKWGAEKDQGIAQVSAALKEMGFSREDVDHMRAMPGGVGKFLDAMRKVGSNFTEDSLIKGDAKTFGMTPEQAAADLKAMQADPEQAKKIMVPGTPERIKRDRLLDIVASAKAA